MSRFAIALGVLLLVGSTARGQWISLGPEGGEVDTVAFDPTDPQVLYAGGLAGLRKSTDGGASWSDADNGITDDTWVLGLLIDPVNPSTLYAGTDGVWKSTDAGATWTHLVNGIPASINIVGAHDPMAIDPAAPSTIYVVGGAGEGVFRSTDAGASWTRVAGGATDVEAVAVDPSSTVYFGTDDGVRKSTDGGVTVSPAGLAGEGVGVLTIAATNPPTLLAGFFTTGVQRSTDGGANWAPANTGLPFPARLIDLAADPTTPSIVWAALFTGGIYRSTDAGLTWSPTAFPSTDFISVLGAGPGGCVAAGSGAHGVFRSCDGGVTWTNGTAGFNGVSVGGFWQDSIAADPTTPRAFHLASDTGVFRTTDGGTTWLPETNHPTGGATVVATAPSNPLRVYTFGFTSGARSDDAGATWSSCAAPPTVPGGLSLAMGLAVDPGDEDTVYVSLYSGPLAKSSDGCASFTLLPSPLNFPGDLGWSVAVDPTNTQRVFLSTFGGLFESLDGGLSWASTNIGSSSNLVRVADDGTVFASANGRLLRRPPGDPFFSSPSGLLDIGFTGFAIDPLRPFRVFVGGTGASDGPAVFYSSDYGHTFTDITFDLRNHEVGTLALDTSGAVLVTGFEGDSTARLNVLCASDAACDDTNGCTIDTCAPDAPGGDVFGCRHVQPDPSCVDACESDAECSQGDLCQTWSCSPGNPNADARGCVLVDSVVCPPAAPCHAAFCNSQTGQCAEYPLTGGACDDANPCTRNDSCQVGVCTGDASPILSCDTSVVAKNTTLRLKNATPDTKDGLVFKLKKGNASNLGELGDPFTVGGASYVGCLYDSSGPGGSPRLLRSMEAEAGEACPNGPCWTPKGAGIRYRNRAGSTSGGADTIEIQPGPVEKTRLSVKAHGTAFATPPGPLVAPVYFQLRRENNPAVCWSGAFVDNITRNDATQFKAKSN